VISRRFAAFGITCLALVSSAFAQRGYAQRTQDIRAGIVVIDSATVGGQPDNPTPHAWYNLDSNTRIKPAGWNIFNPRALTTMTAAANARWSAIASVVGGPVPAVDATLTKRDASYWEVPLTTASDAVIQDYDVLLLSAYGNVSLNPIEREKLRTFVDNGGMLWIDVNADTITNGIDLVNNFPLPFKMTGGGGGLNADFFSPLMTMRVASLRSSMRTSAPYP
jgi:hypothetical protein